MYSNNIEKCISSRVEVAVLLILFFFSISHCYVCLGIYTYYIQVYTVTRGGAHTQTHRNARIVHDIHTSFILIHICIRAREIVWTPIYISRATSAFFFRRKVLWLVLILHVYIYLLPINQRGEDALHYVSMYGKILICSVD